jgi:RNA polymerase sigma-70 factor (ECF subfamily)
MARTDRNEEVLTGLLRLRERATGFAYAVLRDFHAAEDAVQEASVVAVRRLEEFTGEGFDRWFWAILRNVIGTKIRSLRRSMVVPSTELLELLEDSMHREAAESPEEDVDRLIHCLDRLGEPVTRLFRWRFVDRLSCEEIAGQLGRTVQAVYAMIKRSRQTLRDCVEARVHG